MGPPGHRHRDPRHYPWVDHPPADRLVVGDELASWPSSDELAGLIPVVAVGSNAAPHVLRRKVTDPLGRGVPLSPGTIDGLGIGHSAHVSAGGYVAAAPFADHGAMSDVAITWLDAGQLAVLDATEPNYRRVRLPATISCRLPDGRFLDVAEIYDSRHGVLVHAGRPRPLASQADVLTWLHTEIPGHGLDSPHVHDRLTDPGLRALLRRAFATRGLARPSGMA